MQGEAGTPSGRGYMTMSLKDAGAAIKVCGAIFTAENPSLDYEPFNRDTSKCFVIDHANDLSGASEFEVGVWAVPARNEPSFYHHVPEVCEEDVYKIDHIEPQVWIYARPI